VRVGGGGGHLIRWGGFIREEAFINSLNNGKETIGYLNN